MTYGTKVLKNGKQWGYLTFATGKRVVLNPKERTEFDSKINYFIRTYSV